MMVSHRAEYLQAFIHNKTRQEKKATVGLTNIYCGESYQSLFLMSLVIFKSHYAFIFPDFFIIVFMSFEFGNKICLATVNDGL